MAGQQRKRRPRDFSQAAKLVNASRRTASFMAQSSVGRIWGCEWPVAAKESPARERG
jgi:hypothetical protein